MLPPGEPTFQDRPWEGGPLTLGRIESLSLEDQPTQDEGGGGTPCRATASSPYTSWNLGHFTFSAQSSVSHTSPSDPGAPPGGAQQTTTLTSPKAGLPVESRSQG